jgi:single-strand DNA-binding protein
VIVHGRLYCWRGLAEGVASSVALGDPVIVHGRLYTRDWVDTAGMHRTLYELEALAVGHDYARGRAKFARNRLVTATSATEPDEGVRVGGEETEELPGERTGLSPDDPLNEPDGDPAFNDPIEALRASGFDPDPVETYLADARKRGEEDDDLEEEDDDQPIDPINGRRREPVLA